MDSPNTKRVRTAGKYGHSYPLFHEKDGTHYCKICHRGPNGEFLKNPRLQRGVYGARSGKNFADHLKKFHQIEDETHWEVQKALAENEPQETFKVAGDKIYSTSDLLLCFIAKHFLPLSIVECDLFRSITTVPHGLRCGKSVRAALRPLC